MPPHGNCSSCESGTCHEKRTPVQEYIRANEKARSRQGGGQNPRVASDPVAQEPNGQIRSGILLSRSHPVQGSLSEDVHHGGAWPLHRQPSASRNCTSRGHPPPVAADDGQQFVSIHGMTRDAVAHGALPAALALRPHSEQAAQAGSPVGVQGVHRVTQCFQGLH